MKKVFSNFLYLYLKSLKYYKMNISKPCMTNWRGHCPILPSRPKAQGFRHYQVSVTHYDNCWVKQVVNEASKHIKIWSLFHTNVTGTSHYHMMPGSRLCQSYMDLVHPEPEIKKNQNGTCSRNSLRSSSPAWPASTPPQRTSEMRWEKPSW